MVKKKNIIHIITKLVNAGSDENTVFTCNYSVTIGDDVTLVIGQEKDKEILSKIDIFILQLNKNWSKLFLEVLYSFSLSIFSKYETLLVCDCEVIGTSNSESPSVEPIKEVQ